MLIEFQEHGIIMGTSHRRNGNDHILFPPQMPFPHHQMGNVAVHRVDRNELPLVELQRHAVEDLVRLQSLSDLKDKPMELGTYAYDLVLNGVELGSGSIRISEPRLQEAVFEALGLDEEDIKVKFGFLVEAMAYGIPPLGGIGLGLDRTVMLMAGENSIREVIAFPKNSSARDVMADAPSSVEPKQLKELHIKIVE